MDRSLDTLLQRWVQQLTRHGQRSKAERWVREAQQHFQRQLHLASPQETRGALQRALETLRPTLEVRRVRVGGTTHLVPAPLAPSRQMGVALRWLREGARQRRKGTSRSFAQCLALELVEAYHHRGHALQRKLALHRQAEANRAFSHYRWW